MIPRSLIEEAEAVAVQRDIARAALIQVARVLQDNHSGGSKICPGCALLRHITEALERSQPAEPEVT